jgi:hypothetical protein
MWVHIISGTSVCLVSDAMILRMMAYFDWSILKRDHYIIGAIILGLVNIVSLLGFFARRRMIVARWKTGRAMIAKYAH